MKLKIKSTYKNIIENHIARLTAFAILFAMFATIITLNRVEAAGTITGTVYIDYNMNGIRDTSGAAPNSAVDKGVSGVTVTAYDSSGTQQGIANSNASGVYSVAANGTGPYRLEFTNLPSGYSPSSVGTNNGSTVRFVPNGNSSNIDFGTTLPVTYCQNNPFMVNNVYNIGPAAVDTIVAFPYNYSEELDGRLNSVDPTNWTSPPSRTSLLNPTGIADADSVGATFGITYDCRTLKLYSAAYLKRGANFGRLSDSTGAIYATNNPTGSSPTTSLYVDLNGVFGAGTAGVNPHPINTTDFTTDSATPTLVGKRALGGLKLSADGTKLYTVNLSDRRLYVIPTSGTLNSTTITRFDIPTTGLATSNGTCNSADVRPFAVGRDLSGQIYVGGVCSAESETTNTKVHSYIWRFNGSAFTLVANNTLTFARFASATNNATWLRWDNTDTGSLFRPSPMLTDIEFDGNDMVLGFRDRYGDMTIFPDFNRGYGDIMRVCNNAGTFTFESNGTCGGVTSTNPGTNNNSGNGGREFYTDLNGDAREEGGWGGLTQIPGSNDVLTTFYDPVSYNSAGTRVGNNYYTGGVQKYSNTTGAMTGAYDVYLQDGATGGNFGKANGSGDMEVLCDAAPLQVGNRVWNDLNGNGVQDPNETNFSNVAVELWADTTGNGIPDARVGTATTDANGNYIFGGALGTSMSSYTCGSNARNIDVRVDRNSDDAEQLTLLGVMEDDGDLDMFSANGGGTTNYTASGVRFNGLAIPQGATITNAYIEFTANDSGSVTSGSPTFTIRGEDSVNPATYATTNNNITNRTLLPAGLNVSWSPSAWSRTVAYQTPNLSNIVQELVNRGTWVSGNSMAFQVSGSASSAYREAETYNDIQGSAPRLVVEYSVAITCKYKVNPNTAYEVRVPSSNFNTGQALFGFAPTTPKNGGATNGDLRDSDGIVTSGSQVIAPFITGTNGQNNHNYDFGFRAGTMAYSVGNRIWYDTNNDGIINAGEVGISGVSVSIFAANGSGQPTGAALGTVTTDASGYYRFDGLASGNYVIRVNGSNFGTGNVLGGYQNTANTATPTDDGRESFGASSNAENGVNPTGAANGVLANGILSNAFTLSGVLEPQNELDVPSTGTFAGQGSLDNQADMTVDFGFYKLTLNGTAWADTGTGQPGQFSDNGILDTNENRLIGYRTRLFNSANVEIPVGPDGILGTSDDALGGMYTNTSGNYNFMGMPAGQYRVAIVTNGGVSSTPTENDPNLNVDNNDNGFPDNIGSFTGYFISGLVNLTPGVVGGKPNNVVTNSNATTTDPTVDFGIRLAPTLVKIDKFGAYFDGNNVVVEWSTGDESGNLGFNVYRETNGQKELLTDSLIAGSALKTTADLMVKGEGYRWIDKESKHGGVYYIEDMDIDGNLTMHGPVQPSMKFGFESYGQNSSKLISDMVSMNERSTQKEFVGEVSDSDESLQEANSANNFEKQREIAAMKGVKLSVKEAGWYRVSMNQLSQTGFDIDTNKDLWQLFVNGEEIPMQVGADTVEFYGKGLDTNITDEKVYYLVAGRQAGLRLPNVEVGQTSDEVSAESYEITAQRKDRSLYFSALLNGENENWFGSIISPTAERVQTLTANNPFDNGTNEATLKVRLQGLTDVAHYVNVTFNGTQLGTVENYGKGNREFEFAVPMSAVIDGENQIVLQSAGANNDLSLVDTVSLRYARSYVAHNGQIRFSVPAYQTVNVSGFEESGVQLIEIDNDGRAVQELNVSEQKINGTVGFGLNEANYDREFLAINQQEFARNVSKVEANYPSNWNAQDNKARFIIVTPQALNKEAQQLAERRQAQGWKVVVVNVEDIYDEYSFGVRSNEAIKAFLDDASSIWAIKANYVLLFGDSSVDHRNYLNQTNRDLIPTKLIDTEFMETSSDSWLVDFDNDGVEDISLGRLPVGNTVEARLMLAKLQRFDQQQPRLKNTNLLVADNYFESYSDSLEARLPADAGAIKINRSQMSDSQMRSEIISKVNLNPMVVTYSGHGTTGVWASSSVFLGADVANFTNDKLSFFMLMTCLNGYTSHASSDSLAESFIKAENGAIAVWASSGSTYASGQILMSRRATDDLFNINRNPLPIGDIIRNAKATTTDLDARRTWQLIGDPTIVIK